MTVRVPAKINLHLGVGDVRKDAKHELVTVYQAVSLYDEVTVSPDDRLSVSVVGEGASEVPLDSDNLAGRAVLAAAAIAGREPHLRVTIRKGIPVAGGMAGGSADAAAASTARPARLSASRGTSPAPSPTTDTDSRSSGSTVTSSNSDTAW